MVSKYLDKNHKIYVLPKKRSVRLFIYEYLATMFEIGKVYTEKEINEIIGNNHSFNDTCLVRRELIEYKMLERNNDGTSYTRKVKQ